MSGTALAAILRDLRKLCGLQAAEQTTDDALLARFTQANDTAAFTALLQRHAPMLWAICRRLLPEEHATADAFQATALVFARKASSIRKGSSVAGWLARVGYRIALAARKQPRSAEALPSELVDANAPDPSQGAEQREVRRVLDEEIHRLPDKYRLPVVLCFFESRSHAEAAAELRWPIGTVAGRLARAKELLHARLTRRGLTLPGGALATLLTAEGVQAVPFALTAASPRAVLLAQRFLSAEFSKRLWTSLAVLLLTIVGVLATWAALSVHEDPPPQPAPRQAPVAAQLVALRIPRNRMAHNAPVNCLAISPDGKTVASGSSNRGQPAEIKLWNLETCTELFTLKGHGGAVWAVAFSPNGLTLASSSGVAGQPGLIRLWDVRTGKERAPFAGHTDGVSALVYTPDGKTLISSGADMRIILWDVQTGFEQAAIDTGHTGKGQRLALSKDGKLLATASADRTVKLWDLATAKPIVTFADHVDAVRAIVFSPDGKTLASVTGGPNATAGEVKLWDVASATARATQRRPGSWVNALAFSPDGKTLIAANGGGDSTLQLWDAATGAEQAVLRGHASAVSAVAFSPDGKMLLTGSTDCTVKRWDLATRTEHGTLPGHTDGVTWLAYSPDGKTLASVSSDKSIKLWDVRLCQELATLTGHTTSVHAVVFSPDGKTLASGASKGMIKLWDVATKKELATLQGHKEQVSFLAFSADGKLLASASVDRTARLWDVPAMKERAALVGHTAYVERLSFSADGKTLATWSSMDQQVGQLKLWDVAKGAERASFPGVAVAFGPDGQSFALWHTTSLFNGPRAGALRLWDVRQDKEKAHHEGDMQGTPTLLYSPDGKTLALRDWRALKLLVSIAF